MTAPPAPPRPPLPLPLGLLSSAAADRPSSAAAAAGKPRLPAGWRALRAGLLVAGVGGLALYLDAELQGQVAAALGPLAEAVLGVTLGGRGGST